MTNNEKGCIPDSSDNHPIIRNSLTVDNTSKIPNNFNDNNFLSINSQNTTNSNVNETPDSLVEIESIIDFSEIPILKRLESSWEHKIHAINELKNSINSQHDFHCDNVILNILPALISDKNISVQREALDLSKILLQYDYMIINMTLWEKIYYEIVAKCLGQTRLVPFCEDLIMEAFSFLDVKLMNNMFVKTLEEFLENKKDLKGKITYSKTIVGFISCLQKLIKNYGTNFFSIKNIILKISGILGSFDVPVKQASYNILYEIYLWTKDIDSIVLNLDGKQKSEIQRRCQDVKTASPSASRFLKNSSIVPEYSSHKSDDTIPQNGVEDSSHNDVDTFNNLPRIDIRKEINFDKWEKSVICAAKWKEKQSAFDMLTKACETAKRILSIDYSQLLSIIFRTIRMESNITVVVSAIKSCAALAKSLRNDFSIHSKTSANLAIMKLKDKSKHIIMAVVDLLNSLLFVAPIEMYLDEIIKGLSDRSIGGRQYILKWYIKSFSYTNQFISANKCVRKIIPVVLNMLDDSSPEYRSAAVYFFVDLLKSSDDICIKESIDKLPQKKKQVIYEKIMDSNIPQHGVPQICIEDTAESSYKDQPKMSINLVDKVIEKKNDTRKKKNLITLDRHLVKSKTISIPKVDNALIPSLGLDSSQVQSITESLLGQKICRDIEEGINNTDWNLRISTIDTIIYSLENITDKNIYNIHYICVWLCDYIFKNFKEINVNVNRAIITFIQKLPNILGPNYSKLNASTFMLPFIEKISNTKLQQSIKSMVLSYSECFGSSFTLYNISNILKKSQNNKTVNEYLSLMKDIIYKCKLEISSPAILVDCIKNIGNRISPISKGNFISLLVSLYPYLNQKEIHVLESELKSEIIQELLDIISNSSGGKPSSIKKYSYKDNSEKLVNSFNSTIIRDSSIKYLSKFLSYMKSSSKKTQDINLYLKNEVDMLSQRDMLELCIALKDKLDKSNNVNLLKEVILFTAEFGKVLNIENIQKYTKIVLPAIFKKYGEKGSNIMNIVELASKMWLRTNFLHLWIESIIISECLHHSTWEKECIMHSLLNLSEECISEIQFYDGAKSIQDILPSIIKLFNDKSKILRVLTEQFILKISKYVDDGIIHKSISAVKPRESDKIVNMVSMIFRKSSTDFPGVLEKEPLPSFSQFFIIDESFKNLSLDDKLKECNIQKIWRNFVNEPLYQNMFFHNNFDIASVVLTFWKSIVKDQTNLTLIMPMVTQETHILDIFVIWCIWNLSYMTEESYSVNLIEVIFYFFDSFYNMPNKNNFVILSSYLLKITVKPLIEYFKNLDKCKNKIIGCLLFLFKYLLLQYNDFLLCDVFHEILVNTPIIESKQIALELWSFSIFSRNAFNFHLIHKSLNLIEDIIANSKIVSLTDSALKFLFCIYKHINKSIFSFLRDDSTVLELKQYLENRGDVCNDPNKVLDYDSLVLRWNNNDYSMLFEYLFYVENNLMECSSTVNSKIEVLNEITDNLLSSNDIDYESAFKTLNNSYDLEMTFLLIHKNIDSYMEKLSLHENKFKELDIIEDVRRLKHRILKYSEIDIFYWNSIFRLQECLKTQGLSLRFMEEIPKLFRCDPFCIIEGCQKHVHLIDISMCNDPSKNVNNIVQSLSFDIIDGIITSMTFCFNPERLNKSIREKNCLCTAGYYIIILINRLMKIKKILQRIPPMKLIEFIRQLIVAMSCHEYWSGCEHEEIMIRRLNSIVAKDLMDIANLRNLWLLNYMFVDFLIGKSDLDYSIILRVYRKLINKTNTKMPSLPVPQNEIQFFMKILDTALLSLKSLSCSDSLKNVPSENIIPPNEFFKKPFTVENLRFLKGKLESIIKGNIHLGILGLGLEYAKLYFSFQGFTKTTSSLTEKLKYNECRISNKYFMNNNGRTKLEKIMNTQFFESKNDTKCSNQDIQFPTRCLSMPFTDYYNHLVSSKEKVKIYPDTYPEFSLNEFDDIEWPINTVLDQFFSQFRCIFESNSKIGDDVKGIIGLIPRWKNQLRNLSFELSFEDDNACINNAQKALERGFIHYEIIGQYVKRTLGIVSPEIYK